MEDVVLREWDRGCHLEGETPFEEVFLMVSQDELEVLGKGRSHRVVHRGGEGYEDRVSLEGEDSPRDFQKDGFVAGRVAEGRAKFGG